MEEKNTRRIAYITVSIIGGGALIYLFFKHLFFLVLPFFIAWGIAFITRPLADAVNRKTHIPARPLRAVFSILISVLSIGVLCLTVFMLASELWRLLSGLGDGEVLRDLIERITEGGLLGSIFDAFGGRITEVFYEVIISVATSLGSLVTTWLGAVPRVFLFILVTVIASVYFAIDLDRVNSFVKGMIPKKIYEWLSVFRRGFFLAGLSYLRGYAILMLITFGIMLSGLMLLGAEYSLLLAFIIAIADVLPVIGVGTVLIPWGIYEIVFSDSRLGIGLLVLFGVYEIIRQLLEPKIIGKNLGVHPLLSLILIYLCYSLFGFGGILIVPIATVLINIALGKKNTAEVGKGGIREANGA